MLVNYFSERPTTYRTVGYTPHCRTVPNEALSLSSLSLSLSLSLQVRGGVGALDRAAHNQSHTQRAPRGSYSAVFVHQSLAESGEVTAAACARLGTLAEKFTLRAVIKFSKVSALVCLLYKSTVEL